MTSAIVAASVALRPASTGKGSCAVVNQCARGSPIVASATQPRPRLASVMPSWLAERTRPRLFVARSARRAFRSPVRVMASRRVRRERTRANSTATKNPLSASRPMMARIRTRGSYPAAPARRQTPAPRRVARAPPGRDISAMHPGHADHAHDRAHDRAHGHAHEHGHPGHAHGRGATARRLWIALGLTAVFLVAEVVGGIVSNSLALLADAGHMLTDVAALGLSLFVHWFSRRAESPSKTYGYLRLEILAAFLNGATLLLVSAWIIVEAIGRLSVPEAVSGGV